MSEPTHHIKQNAEHHAQQDGSGQRKVECRVFAAINNVAREASDWEIAAAQQYERDPRNHHDRAKKNQQFSNVHHVFILPASSPSCIRLAPARIPA